jgi:hypothetical protein
MDSLGERGHTQTPPMSKRTTLGAFCGAIVQVSAPNHRAKMRKMPNNVAKINCKNQKSVWIITG